MAGQGRGVVRRTSWTPFVAGLAVAALVAAWPTDASPEAGRPIEVGEVSAAAPGAGPAAVGELRRALEGAARAIAMGRHSRRVHSTLVIAGSVTRLDQERRGGRLRVRCEVSLLLLESPGGRMRAVLTGRAMSEAGVPTSRAELEGLRLGVVGTAARSALDRLETVIDQI